MANAEQMAQKAKKREAALRDNLKKRKAFIKDTKQAKKESKNGQ